MLQTFAFGIAARVWKYLWTLEMFKSPHWWATLIVWKAELEPTREIGDIKIGDNKNTLGKGNLNS